MKILVINSGTASLKFKLFDLPSEKEVCEGQFKHYDATSFTFEIFGDGIPTQKVSIHKDRWDDRLDQLLEALKSLNLIINSNEISTVAHRIVHGGEKYTKATFLTQEVIDDLKRNYNDFAPLHNPVQIEIVEKVSQLIPDAKQIGVFDTAFNMTIKPEAFLYGLPYEYYEKYKVRRYGFHGISHKFILSELKKILPQKSNRIISCHLGSGSSICAIKDNSVVENSFGFSPNENLVMSTRAGDVDFDALVFLKKKLSISDNEIDDVLNNKSGLLGLSGYTADMKTLINDYPNNEKAKLAVDIFVYNVVKNIASFIPILAGLDVLIFTAGIGQGSDVVRKMVIDGLKPFSIDIDDSINSGAIDVEGNLNITGKNSESEVWVIHTNEELQMVRESIALL